MYENSMKFNEKGEGGGEEEEEEGEKVEKMRTGGAKEE